MQFVEDRQEAIVLLRDAIDTIRPDDYATEKLRLELYWLLEMCIAPDQEDLSVYKNTLRASSKDT